VVEIANGTYRTMETKISISAARRSRTAMSMATVRAATTAAAYFAAVAPDAGVIDEEDGGV